MNAAIPILESLPTVAGWSNPIAYARIMAAHLASEVLPRYPSAFTFDPISWSLPKFRPEVFIVSLEGYVQKFDKQPTEEELFGWILRNVELFLRSGFYVGLWQDSHGVYHLDVSIAVVGEEFALATASMNHQTEIYYPAEDRCIVVNNALRLLERPEGKALAEV